MDRFKEQLVAIVKEDCPTCRLVAPVLVELSARLPELVVYSQDNPDFPAGLAGVRDDTDLAVSYGLEVEIVPTLVKFSSGEETGRTAGWSREEWQALTGIEALGVGLPPFKPGCGSRSVEPGTAEALAVRFGKTGLSARRVELGALEDPIEAAFARGWTDGLPVVPPTEARVYRMARAVDRDPSETIAVMPMNKAPVTVEKAAINAVMAGCKPEYFPIVLAAVEAACEEAFGLTGVSATTWFSSPVIVVNGPIAERVGMNSGFNVFGQGNRANATIGRALNLLVRNVGQVVPGALDRSTFGYPGKYTFCFAEAESGTSWAPLSIARGIPAGRSAVTLFAGEGVLAIGDETSRSPESLVRTYAASLRVVYNARRPLDAPLLLAVSPEHGRVFERAGWSKTNLNERLEEILLMDSNAIIAGTDGIEEGIARERAVAEPRVPKFRPGGILIVRAGSPAGLYSAAIPGWPGGKGGSHPVTKEIKDV